MHRVCIVGAGIGAEHASGYATLPDSFAIHSICDLDAARGRRLADEYGAGFTADLNDVLADPTVDILDICLPPHLHFRACMAALDAGKKVICEKPLATSLAEADALAARLAETSGFLSPVFQYRYGIGASQLHALMQAGLAGSFFTGSLETHWDRDSAYYGNGWRGTWAGEQGGAVLTHARCVSGSAVHWAKGAGKGAKKTDAVAADGGASTGSMSTTHCTGLNILKDGKDPEFMPDDQYPDWLWTILDPEKGNIAMKTLGELEKELEAARGEIERMQPQAAADSQQLAAMGLNVEVDPGTGKVRVGSVRRGPGGGEESGENGEIGEETRGPIPGAGDSRAPSAGSVPGGLLLGPEGAKTPAGRAAVAALMAGLDVSREAGDGEDDDDAFEAPPNWKVADLS